MFLCVIEISMVIAIELTFEFVSERQSMSTSVLQTEFEWLRRMLSDLQSRSMYRFRLTELGDCCSQPAGGREGRGNPTMSKHSKE